MAPPSALLDTPSTVHLLMLQGSKVDLQGARSTSSSLGDSPAMRLGVGVHPTGPARSIDLVPRGEPSIMHAWTWLGWQRHAVCTKQDAPPAAGKKFHLHTARCGMPYLASFKQAQQQGDSGDKVFFNSAFRFSWYHFQGIC